MERQLWTMVGAIASIALALGVVALPADAATRPYCGLRWGSLQKQIGRGPGFPPSPLVGVRAGRHACFDRLVFDHDGVIAGGAVRYVSRVTTEAVEPWTTRATIRSRARPGEPGATANPAATRPDVPIG